MTAVKYEEAIIIAEKVKAMLKPHCERIEIAGSVRRKKPEVKDIEIVAIPKPYDIGLFTSGIALVVNQWPKVKGELPCRYTQRILPEGIKLDLFFADEDNWGMIYAIRTGSADFSRNLASAWSRKGFKSIRGNLHKFDWEFKFREEEDLFKFLGMPYVDPVDRI